MLSTLGGDTFVHDYWQQCPLVVTGAWRSPPQFLGADELAGLATDPAIASRIVMGDTEAEDWMIIEGPVTETFFSDTPETDWQLTVHGVDRHVPVYAAVREAFRFLPDWRFDAVAISYCVPGGTTGHNEDDADLFFLQVSGDTDWSIHEPVESAAGACGQSARQAWNLRTGPGDLVYLPPYTGYYGVARTEGVTYCIRFRAPTPAELLRTWAQDRAQQLEHHADEIVNSQAPAANPAALPEATRAQLRAALRAYLDPSDRELDEWLARYLTRPDETLDAEPTDSAPTSMAIREALAAGRELVVDPMARLAWLTTADNGVLLYVNGYPQPAPSSAQGVLVGFAQARRFTGADLATADDAGAGAVVELLATGLRWGWLAFHDELVG